MEKIFVIAKWELRASRLKFDKRNVILLFLLCISLCCAIKTTDFRDESVVKGIYDIQVVNAPIIKEALTLDGRFNILENDKLMFSLLRSDKLDLIVVSNKDFIVIYHSKSKKSEGALDALEQAVKRYKVKMLWQVSDEEVTKAFPLWTQTHYLRRVERFQYYTLGGEAQKTEEKKKITTSENLLSNAPEPTPLKEEKAQEIVRYFKGDGKEKNIAPKDYVLPPALLSPPLPFYSTIIAFIFALPLYLFSQFYSQSVMDEKTNKKVELLLASPIKAKELVLGKMSVYFILTLVTEFIISIAILKKLDFVVIATLIPVILIFMAVSFFSSLMSRSFKENSFIIVFFSVILLAYFYFPAMFYNIHAISKISPITLIVKIIEGEGVELKEYLFATLPLYLCSTLIFYFGIITFKEEHLFNQKGLIEKTLEITKEFLKKGREELSLFIFSLSMVPIAYLLELLYLILFFQIPMPYCIYIMLLVSAFTEEFLKISGVIALQYSSDKKMKLAYPVISAIGFFIGERIMKIITISQITDSMFGLAMFKEYFFISLILHVTCTSLASLPLILKNKEHKRLLPISIILASILHAAYNYYLVAS